MSTTGDERSEIERFRNVIDMMVTAHAYLNEHYFRLSLISDIFLFSSTVILCVVAFADPALLTKVLGVNFSIYAGIFAVLTFIYSFIANSLDWKVKAEKHKAAFEKYVDLKCQCNDIVEQARKGKECEPRTFIEKYFTMTASIISIPEPLFLKCKKHHKLKVTISKHLDQHPGTSILMFKLKLWIANNLRETS
jgi:uncharacterized membrane protein